VKKYSNFVGSPIFLNGNQLNLVQPLWLMEPKEVTDEQHMDFYRYIANSFDIPRFKIHFKTDVPVSIRAVLYFPGEFQFLVVDCTTRLGKGTVLSTKHTNCA
jgi:TNF receptor-associated protein 1